MQANDIEKKYRAAIDYKGKCWCRMFVQPHPSPHPCPGVLFGGKCVDGLSDSLTQEMHKVAEDISKNNVPVNLQSHNVFRKSTI